MIQSPDKEMVTERYTLCTSGAVISIEDYLRDYSNISYFLSMCQKCSSYGKRWCCPPFSFDVKTKVLQFAYAHIVGIKIIFSDKIKEEAKSLRNGEEISNDSIREVWHWSHPKLLKLRELYAPAMAFSIGCHLCGEGACCRGKGEECLHPDKMLYSLESFGFDMAKSAKQLLDIELLWSNNGELPEYLTLVMGIFSNTRIDEIAQYFKPFCK